MKRILASVSCMVLVFFCLGGSSCYGTYDITTAWDEKTPPGVFQVDVFAVNEDSAWKSKSIDAYFAPDSANRREARDFYKARTIDFSDQSKGPKTIRESEWPAEWKGKPFLVIMADLRWLTDREDAPGSNTKRQWIMPLNSKCWDVAEVKVLVRKDGLHHYPDPKPVK